MYGDGGFTAGVEVDVDVGVVLDAGINCCCSM